MAWKDVLAVPWSGREKEVGPVLRKRKRPALALYF